MTPTDLATTSADQIQALADQFGRYFECDAPSTEQITAAITDVLFRWPAGSLDEGWTRRPPVKATRLASSEFCKRHL